MRFLHFICIFCSLLLFNPLKAASIAPELKQLTSPFQVDAAIKKYTQLIRGLGDKLGITPTIPTIPFGADLNKKKQIGTQIINAYKSLLAEEERRNPSAAITSIPSASATSSLSAINISVGPIQEPSKASTPSVMTSNSIPSLVEPEFGG